MGMLIIMILTILMIIIRSILIQSWDYSFHNWEEDAQIIEGTEDFKYLSKGEIELRKNDEKL